MVSWAIKDFGGEIPRQAPRALPDNMAEAAWNVDLAGGPLDGLGAPTAVVDLSGVSGAVLRAYRVPGPNPGDDDAWLGLPSPHSSPVRSPLANDTLHRVYWTNPAGLGADGAFWSTYGRIKAGGTGGNAPYNLGSVLPNAATVSLTVAVTGGTTGVPSIDRAYCYTYQSIYGEESAPSLPSAVVSGLPDGTWTVHGMPTSRPGSPGGKNYPVVQGVWLYRTVVGASTGGQFYRVAFFDYGATPPPSTYTDTQLDVVVVDNPALISASFANPPALLDGLAVMPGGMMVGFTANTVHFCEPDRPHAWPAGYDQSLHYEIVALRVWQSALMAMTTGFPSSGSGTSPANFSFSEIQVPEPCVSRGSAVVDLMGVYYASQNGLVMLNYYGMQNQTLSNLTTNIWRTDFNADAIIACRHRAQYLAINGTGVGFEIDYTDQRMGIVRLNTFTNATCIWNDIYTGDTYICADKVVYLWDAPGAPALTYRWRSKQFYLPSPDNIGACQVELAADVLDPAPLDPVVLLTNNDTRLDLPAGVNAMFHFYAGNNLDLIYSRPLVKMQDMFRLPSGRKDFLFQFEIVSRVPVHSVELASTMKELRRV